MTEPETPLIEAVVDGRVATLTLNRPDRHNSLVLPLLRALIEATETTADDPEVRVVVLAANGASFSTGGDVGAFYEHIGDLEDYADELVGLLNDAMLALMRMPQPVIAAVHGVVTGGSIGLVLASDIAVVSEAASFTPWYSVVGFAPDGGWTAILPDRIGKDRTADVLLNNGTISAEQAVAWGIATEMASGEEFDRRISELADRMAGARTTAVKRSLNSDIADVAQRLEVERRAFVEQVATEESINGMAAFLGRDRPLI